MSLNSFDLEIHAKVLVTSWGYKLNIFCICSAFDVTVSLYENVKKKKNPQSAEESTEKDKVWNWYLMP